jgi:hypothetical protein
MDVGRAAFLTECQLKKNWGVIPWTRGLVFPQPARSEEGWGPSHAVWMLAEVQNQSKVWKNDKLNRWLGYAQAILVCYKFLTLEECKRCNKDA